MDIVTGKHDGFFKALMEQPGAAGALLRERLPKAIADALGPGEPELVEGTFIDEELRESRSDRLYRIRLKEGDSAYVYCLVEHKSAPDARIAWQLLRYMARVWDRIDRDAGNRGKLPPVVPLVVYHGAEEWKVPRRFLGMVDASPEMAPELRDFPFEVVDVGRVENTQLSRERTLRFGLTVLKYGPLVTKENRIEVTVVVLAAGKGLAEEFLWQGVRYMMKTYGPMDLAALSQGFKQTMPEKEQEMLSLAAKEFLAQGEAEGEAKGEAKALLRVLERRFGAVPARVREVVSTAGTDELEAWLDKVIDAPSIEAVFGPSAH